MKKFWKRTEGFTLVELIVVIAILGILAGVGTVGYSGYIKKANEAADQAQLSSLNTAFITACIQNGIDNTKVTDAATDFDAAEKKVTGLTSIDIDGVADDVEEKIKADFDSLFEGAQFKVADILTFDKGVFTTSIATSVTVNGITYTADEQSIAAFLNGALGQKPSQAVLDMVSIAAGSLGATVGSDDFAAAVSAQTYKDAASAMLGMSYDDYVAAKQEEAAKRYCEEQGWDYDDEFFRAMAENETGDSAKQKIDQNLMPLVGAAKTQEASTTILDILKNANAKDTITGNIKDGANTTLGLSQAALAYGLYTSYAESNGKDSSVAAFAATLGDTTSDFHTYLSGSDVDKDLASVLAAMKVVSNQNSDAVKNTVDKGFTDPDLADALKQLLGK